MYEEYSRQSLPSKKYRELLGTAICVFNSNNSFIIENILRHDDGKEYSWHELIDRTSGGLFEPIKNTIIQKSNRVIARKFNDIVNKRNRIMHSFQITAPADSNVSEDPDNQILATKYRSGRQEIITESFLYDFIQENDELSSELHKFRGY